jgi:IS30 family transposase
MVGNGDMADSTDEFNTRPRKTLGYKNPAAVFDEALR